MKKKKKNLLKRITIAMLLICTLLQSQKSVFADTEKQPSTMQQTNDASKDNNENNPIISLSQENIKNFIDDYFQTNMEKWNVPGAAVAVVENGKELYKSGYGVGNIETQNPVDPDSTTFPAASVSKLFTATAIMQLYQSGKLDLNENIQSYLDDISIKNPFDEPVTCQNLLTHSSGLDEESELDGSTLDRAAIKSQKQYFEEHIPTVIIQPNTVCRYSNMGYNLLGYVVEKVSGESYEDYVANHILAPLHMEHSSIRVENQSMENGSTTSSSMAGSLMETGSMKGSSIETSSIETNSIETSSMASGYEYSDGQYQKMPFAYQYTSGSSGVISTVSDMENFMMMHLNHGTYETSSILNSNTEALMQKKQFANNEVFEGMGESFIRDSWNGVQILKHEGALPGYTTTLLLIPGQNFGIYVATNSLGGMVFDFEEAFLEHFFGTPNTVNNVNKANNTNNTNDTTNQNNNSNNINKYIGTYRTYDSFSMNNISKILATVDNTAEFKIEKSDNGNLIVTYYEESKEKVKTNLNYQSEGIFIREDGKGYITFRENNSGNIIYAFNNISHQTYMKIGFFETSSFICVELLVLIFLLLGSAIFIIIKRIRHKQKNNEKLWLVNCLINFAYIFSFVGVFILECYMILNYDYRFMSMIYILLSILLVAIAANIVELFVFCYGIIKKKFDIKTIIKLALIQISQILFIITLGYFNMIGYHIF